MSKRIISFLILSNGTRKARQIDLPIKRYKLFRNGLIVLALILSYVCVDYARLRFAHMEFSELKRTKCRTEDRAKRVCQKDQRGRGQAREAKRL